MRKNKNKKCRNCEENHDYSKGLFTLLMIKHWKMPSEKSKN